MLVAIVLMWNDVKEVWYSTQRKESERTKKNSAAVVSRLDGLVMRLGLLCLSVSALSQSSSSRAKLADLS